MIWRQRFQIIMMIIKKLSLWVLLIYLLNNINGEIIIDGVRKYEVPIDTRLQKGIRPQAVGPVHGYARGLADGRVVINPSSSSVTWFQPW